MASGVDFKMSRALLVVLAVLAALAILYYSSRSPNSKVCQTDENSVRISELIAASIDLSQRGGSEVRAVRRGGSGIGEEVKGKTSVNTKDFVTQGDKRSHEAIVAGLSARWAQLEYVSEERFPVDSTSVACPSVENSEVVEVLEVVDDPPIPLEDILVWIDPLDATQEYTEGGEHPELLRYVTVMMCVCVKGEPVAGVIHRAFEGTSGVTYWGWVGHGFSRNIRAVVDTAKHRSNVKKVESETVRAIVSRSHAGDAKKELESMFKQGVDVTGAAGAGYKLLQVLNGTTDLYFHSTYIKKWDLCAGEAMLRAAGGKMSTRKGEVLSYAKGDPLNKDGVVASLDHHDWYLSMAKKD